MRAAFFWALTALTAVYAQKMSSTGRCGAANGGLVCTGSSYGNCCSSHGWCGSTALYCGTDCDSAHGTCTISSAPTEEISADGSCVGSKGYTCQGSKFGSCCSSHSYCGSSSVYCGTGCNPAFGACSSGDQSSSTRALTTLQIATRSSSVITAASPSSSVKVSTNARCGNADGATGGFSCLGSKFGDCCSQYSYCGITSDYCGIGCQAGFGKCNSKSSSVRSSSSSVRPSSSSVRSSSSSVRSSSSSSVRSSSSSVQSSSSSVWSSSPISSSSSISSVSSSQASAVSTYSTSASSTQPTVSSSTIASTTLDSPSSSSVVTSSSVASSTLVSLSSLASSIDQSSSLSTPSISSTQSASVTSIVLPTPSPSSTESCLAASTNYVSNGGFESGNGDGFQISALRTRFSFVDTGGYSGKYLVRGFPASIAQTNTANIQQLNIMIPSGTEVNVFAFARSLRTDLSAIQRFRIFLDNVNLGTVTALNGEWSKVGASSSYTVLGDSHTLLFTVENNAGALSSSPVFDVDDITIVALYGPSRLDLCATPSPSSNIASSASIQSSFESSSASLTQSSSVSASAVDSVALSSTMSLSSSSEPIPSTSSIVSSPVSQSSTSDTTPSSSSESYASITLSTMSSSLISSSASPTSTPEVTSTLTPTPSPSAGCLASTTYLVNPGFEGLNGLQPWGSSGITGPWSSLSKSSASGVHSGTYTFRAATYDIGIATVYLNQPRIAIPSGTQIIASVWAKLLRPLPSSGTPFTFTLYINSGNGDYELLTLDPSQSSAEWVQLVSSSPVTLAGDLHDFKVYFATQGYTGPVVAVDDLALTACIVDSITSTPPNPPSTPEPTPNSSVTDSSTLAVSSSDQSLSSSSASSSVVSENQSSTIEASTSSSTVSLSESPSITPEPSPSYSSTVQSSTPEPNTSSSSEVDSSTPTPTSTPTPAPTPTPSCFSAPTNYLINTGFESYNGLLQSPWALSAQSSNWNLDTTKVYSSSPYLHSGTNGFAGYTSARSALSRLTLGQVVTIPIGVTVKVGVWFRIFNLQPNTVTVSLTVDDDQVVNLRPNSIEWTELVPTSNTLLSTATQSSHTITLTVVTIGLVNQAIFAADDFYITPISGPNGETICAAP